MGGGGRCQGSPWEVDKESRKSFPQQVTFECRSEGSKRWRKVLQPVGSTEVRVWLCVDQASRRSAWPGQSEWRGTGQSEWRGM